MKIALPNWVYLKLMIRTLKQYIGTLVSKRWAMSIYDSKARRGNSRSDFSGTVI